MDRNAQRPRDPIRSSAWPTKVNSDIAVAPELDAIAATDPGPFVWAISKSTRTLYRVTNTSKPAVTGTIVFGSPPVALAVNAQSVWVGTQDGTGHPDPILTHSSACPPQLAAGRSAQAGKEVARESRRPEGSNLGSGGAKPGTAPRLDLESIVRRDLLKALAGPQRPATLET